MSKSKLILPGGVGDADAIARDRLDEAASKRGTNRNLKLLRQRKFRTTRRPKGLCGTL